VSPPTAAAGAPPPSPSPAPRWPAPVVALGIVLATAAAYAALGLAALGLAVPPAFAAPLFPAAGLALAAALVWGRAALPGVFLGSLAVNAWGAYLRDDLGAPALLLAALIGLGAAAQAGVGRWLVARRCGLPVALAEPRDIACFYAFAVPLSCLVSASVATSAFVAWGLTPAAEAAALWWRWWSGDTLGVLIGAPIVLSLLARPRVDWAPRRLSLALPLLAITALLAAAILEVAQWDEERIASRFERDAQAAAAVLTAELRRPLYVLAAVRSLLVASEEVTDAELRTAVRPWQAQDPSLRAVGRSEWVLRAEVDALQARRRAEGAADFAVFDRPDGTDTTADDALMVITQIEPLADNRAALGLNQRSVPAARAAIERARDSGTPVATAGFRLTQAEDRVGVVVYQALYEGEPASAAQRAAATRGLVFVTVEPERLLAGVGAAPPTYLRLCLFDADPLATTPLLAGDAGCLAAADPATLALDLPLAFAGRDWRIGVRAPRAAVPDDAGADAWLFSLVALGATALLGALLLTVTGRTRRIEAAVEARTAALQQEVAERQRAESALRERERRLRTIFESAPVGIVYTDLDGRILAPNPAFCALVGRGVEELTRATMAELAVGEDSDDARRRLADLRAGRADSYRCARRYRRADGGVVHTRVTVALLRDDRGQPRRTIGVVEDVGEQLRLAQAERERDAAAEANRAKSEFVSRMSHELRTPLNAMLGFAQLLELDRQPALAPHQAGWTAQIQRAGWHLLHMINDTLDLSRIEAGTLELRAETLDLRELLPACLALVEPQARARRLRLDWRVEPAAAAVVADLTRLKQVLTNLLSNAVKYNVEGGTVQVDAHVGDDGQVAIDVLDSGLGMDAQQLAHLFEPFNRLGREASGVEGTGIGLTIARRLAELMGGSLHARSAPGAGSCFTLRLPAGALDTLAASLAEAAEALAVRYRSRVVHYVEDNPTNAEVMRGVLGQRPQVRLELSADGASALAAIRASRPDLVLLDMHLPDIDGLELLRRLKDDPDTEAIPVVAVSADATRERSEQALREGALHYLTKPVNVAELLGVIDDLLERQDTRFG
jgi:PAS domain S-box-containing protein